MLVKEEFSPFITSRYFGIFKEGDIINNNLILDPIVYRKNNTANAYVLVRCKCGREYYKKVYELKKSYKCQTCFNLPGNASMSWQGYGEISLTQFNNIKSKAKKRKIEFNLSIENLWNLFIEQNRKCAISGEFLILPQATRSSSGTASLDRIDSSKGYTTDNVQWVSKKINMAKRKSSDEEFIQMCKMITEYQNSKNK